MFITKTISISTALLLAAFAAGHTDNAYSGDDDFNQLLKGDYAYSQAETCVVTSSDAPVIPTFDPVTLQLLGDAEVQNLQSRGISSFDGAGNWSGTGTGMGLSLDQTQAGDFPVGPPVTVSCEGTYSVSVDRSFLLDYSCDAPALGISFGPRVLQGRISSDRKTLIIDDTETGIEELKILGTNVVVAERICTAIATDAKLIPSR